jgi:quinol monooxygenase YgiN
MKEAAFTIVYPTPQTFNTHYQAVLAMIPETRSFPGCLQAHIGCNQNRLEIFVFHLWETADHLDKYMTWRAERGDLDARSATMRQEQEFRTYSVQ